MQRLHDQVHITIRVLTRPEDGAAATGPPSYPLVAMVEIEAHRVVLAGASSEPLQSEPLGESRQPC